MSFPRYPKYKPSAVEWLGEVPEGWGVVPLKHIAEFINGDAFKPVDWADSGLPIIRIQNLNGSEDFNFFNGTIEPRYLVHDGDLLFGWSGNRGTSFGPFLWRRNEVCVLNQHIFRVVPKSLCTNVLFWTLKAVTAHVEDQAHGIIGMVHITKGDLGTIAVPIPPLPEQTAIASFLYHETAKIDALIAEQQRLIELLKEKRQAVISHAVTKGLNPHVRMKDSGVEWLGEVPEHWEVMSFRNFADVVRGASPRPAGDPLLFNGNFMPWVTVAEITKDNQKYLNETAAFLTELGAQGSRTFQPNTLIYSNSGATLGVPKILKIQACANDGVIGFLNLSDKANSSFLYFFLLSITEAIREKVKQGSGQPNLNTDIVKALKCPIPPINEQELIVKHVEEICSKFDYLKTICSDTIALLQERRTALISAAVTGQIDVRGFTPVAA